MNDNDNNNNRNLYYIIIYIAILSYNDSLVQYHFYTSLLLKFFSILLFVAMSARIVVKHDIRPYNSLSSSYNH